MRNTSMCILKIIIFVSVKIIQSNCSDFSGNRSVRSPMFDGPAYKTIKHVSKNNYHWLPCPTTTSLGDGNTIAMYPKNCNHFYICHKKNFGYESILYDCNVGDRFTNGDDQCRRGNCDDPPLWTDAQWEDLQRKGGLPPGVTPQAPPTTTTTTTTTTRPPQPIISGKPLKGVDVAVGVQKLKWMEAKRHCQDSDLTLLIIKTQQENDFLNDFERLRQPPFKRLKEVFWTGAKFKTTDYKALYWEPIKELIPNFLDINYNGIKRTWAPGEPSDDSEAGKDLCVGIQFPGNRPPVWSALDCSEEKYYICVRFEADRDLHSPQAVLEGKQKTTNKGKEGADEGSDSGGVVADFKNGDTHVLSGKDLTPLTDKSMAVSKGKLSWPDAVSSCKKSHLELMVIDRQDDNDFFINTRMLKKEPYKADTRFWSAGKLEEGANDKVLLFWEPVHIEFPDYTNDTSNGIIKSWVGVTDDTEGAMCLDMQFPSRGPPLWSASDCMEKRHYICMRQPLDRTPAKEKTLSPAKIEGDTAD